MQVYTNMILYWEGSYCHTAGWLCDSSRPHRGQRTAGARMPRCQAVPYIATQSAPAPSLPEIELRNVLALDGSPVRCAVTAAGYAGSCVDLGVSSEEPSSRWRQLFFLPTATPSVSSYAASLSTSLQTRLDHVQHGAPCAAVRTAHVVMALPSIGTCATIEYGMLSLAEAASRGARLILGRHSTPVWTSRWFCAGCRSLDCYFNISAGCCAGAGAVGSSPLSSPLSSASPRTGSSRPTKTARSAAAAQSAKAVKPRRNGASSRALTLGGDLSGFNVHGTLWVSGQLVLWLFRHMLPAVRAEIDARRASVFPRDEVSALPRTVERRVERRASVLSPRVNSRASRRASHLAPRVAHHALCIAHRRADAHAAPR